MLWCGISARTAEECDQLRSRLRTWWREGRKSVPAPDSAVAHLSGSSDKNSSPDDSLVDVQDADADGASEEAKSVADGAAEGTAGRPEEHREDLLAGYFGWDVLSRFKRYLWG